jgi:HEAT repeat protein
MRSIVIGVGFGALCVCGCGESTPPLAGGKPVSHWIEALRDPDPKVRKTAVTKLGNVGPADPAAVPALIGALKDPDATVRTEAVLAVVKSDAALNAAIAALSEMQQKDRDARVRAIAGKALDKLKDSAK